MKIFFLFGIIGCLCVAIPAKAQLQEGTRYWGGSVGFGGTSNHVQKAGNSNQFSFNPTVQFGKFIKVNRVAGIGLISAVSIFWWKDTSSEPHERSNTRQVSYTLSPFIRQYQSLSPKWAVFLNSSLPISYQTSKSKSAGEKQTRTGYAAGIRIVPGVSYWVSPRFALESDINLLSLEAGYRDFLDVKSMYLNSMITSSLTSYFNIRASWYLQKP